MPDVPATFPRSRLEAPRPTGSGAVDAAVAIWSALAALGTGDVVLAPGSRSAPLVYALGEGQVAGQLDAHVRIDERASAFTALGISRHDPARPAAVVTTSGTATAHLLAAVMEAHHSRIPLLVLTADRPAELKGVGANQTTRQAGLFSSLVRFEADLPAPNADAATPVELRTAVSTAARAFAAATGEHPGPVHLNLGFRDPLVPAAPGSRPRCPESADGQEPAPIVLTRRADRGAPHPQPVPVDGATVVVAGDGAGAAATRFAHRHRLPLLAEPSSGARDGETLVPGYPALLAEVMADRDHALRPSRAIVFGRPTLSRPVIGALLGADDVDVIVVDPGADWTDAARRAQLVVPAADGRGAPAPARWLEAWREAAQRVSRAAGEPSWQQRAALAVWQATTAGDILVLGSSSLVRDLEQRAGSTPGRVIANRGLAGIDGTTSVAGGIALAHTRERARTGRDSRDDPTASGQDSRPPSSGQRTAGRVRALMGDLTALHDLTGLIIGPDEQTPELDLVVVDDGGGRIFAGLEHAAAPPELLRRFFTTPHGTDLAAAAAALGASARTVDVDGLPAALATPATGLRMIVVQEGPSPLSPSS
ncbi:MAG TPA: 2-succinyl-5-enolpyruvyl-6-hydroxy-3-cyclohexene-1-carboxylic-acid synthase [Candidatus Brachybacterium merdavium]|uniref:2-succinyl-5-enolpyruvyl-6-hydroxy-3-cyclohexene-1-carboxylate synthase n=1 Tax=Candidatus Brachybacterium merdavium TaxID=2838513 RepID=A0A9D2LBR7_9MICO|nr:2-succinyl-5-enolpyruvyl-6-hydroxy-3-cyclohexene-1-carboxylic-acid synthase [Candidatus Brachybacterium merdavium]